MLIIMIIIISINIPAITVMLPWSIWHLCCTVSSILGELCSYGLYSYGIYGYGTLSSISGEVCTGTWQCMFYANASAHVDAQADTHARPNVTTHASIYAHIHALGYSHISSHVYTNVCTQVYVHTQTPSISKLMQIVQDIKEQVRNATHTHERVRAGVRVCAPVHAKTVYRS